MRGATPYRFAVPPWVRSLTEKDFGMLTGASAVAAKTLAPAKSAAFNYETVLSVHHYTESLFRFETTRDPAFRFESGQFAMIGLEVDGKPLLRAYSMASANYDETLTFFSIKVANGPLTSRLQHIKVGDTVLIGRKPTGTLVQSSLLPGKRLYLLSTGTGIAPFASIIRDPEIYDRYETVVLAHGCRTVPELTFGFEIVRDVKDHEFLGEVAADKLLHYPTVTREAFHHQGRVTDLTANGRMMADLGLPPLDPAHDRVMICGNPEMLNDLRAMLPPRGFVEGSGGEPGSFVIEKAFVER